MKLSYEIHGSGEPLLLIHGLGSAATAWKPVLPLLTSQFQVITVDLPGHGKTPLQQGIALHPAALSTYVAETLEDLGIEQFHVAGNSLGGWVALELAAAHPERVKSVIGLAPAGLWLAPYNSRVPGATTARFMAKPLHKVSPHLLKNKWAKKIGFGTVSPLWEQLSLETCVDAANAMGTSEGYFPVWDSFLGLRFEKSIDSSIPITIIFGDSDNTLPVRTSQERSLVPAHAKWIVLPQCGHAPMWDHPAEVVSEIFETVRTSR